MNIEQLRALFLLSGYTVLQEHELANNYWPDCEAYAEVRRQSPWWLVQTDAGLIKVGWRKRVICIDWSPTGFALAPAEVTADEVTLTEIWSTLGGTARPCPTSRRSGPVC